MSRPIDERGPEWLRRALQTAQSVGAISGLLLVTGYVMGFLVVNNYLAGYGVRDIEPLRARYLAAAVPFAALVTLTLFTAAELIAEATRPHGFLTALGSRFRRGWANRAAALVGYGSVVFLSAVTDALVLIGLGVQLPGFGAYLTLVAFAGAVLLVAGFVREREATWRPGLQTNTSLAAIVLSVFAVGAYATTIYPLLPTWVGGGKPDDVELAVTESVSAVCVPCRQAATLKLIDEDSTRIVVLVTDAAGTRAIEISRSDVHAISHKPKPTTQP